MKSFCFCHKLETGGIVSCYFAVFLSILDIIIASVLLYAWFTGEWIYHDNNQEYEKLIFVSSCVNIFMSLFILVVAIKVITRLKTFSTNGLLSKSAPKLVDCLKKFYVYFFTSIIFYKLYVLMHAFKEYDLTILYAVTAVILVLCFYFMVTLQFLVKVLENNLNVGDIQDGHVF